MAAAFVAMNEVYGPFFGVSRAEAQDKDMANARAKALAGQFVMDTHTHFLRDDTRIMTFVRQREAVGRRSTSGTAASAATSATATSSSREPLSLRGLVAAAVVLVAAAWPLGLASAHELRMVPLTVDGAAVRLAMRVYRPPTPGPVPTLVFHHGSTGTGTDPALAVRPIDFPALAQFFVDRGWAVVLPSRRGRGGSDGDYDEGMAEDRTTGYSCDPTRSIPGADRALRDIEAAMDEILAMPFVDRTRVVVGGQSRGGILAVAYAGRRPAQVKGVLNFVGGWHGTGCMVARDVNQALFVRGARYPGETLWLYGDGDPFYALDHSRANFAAFQAAGGKGTFVEFPQPAGAIGHVIFAYPALWGAQVDAYLTRLGLRPGSSAPPGSGR